MPGFTLKDLQQLDAVSYDEIDKTLQLAEETRAIVEYRLRKIGSLTDKNTYDAYDNMLSELKQTKDIQRRRAIIQKIREENVKG